MSPAISRILSDPNRDLIGIMSNGSVITRRVTEEGSPAGRASGTASPDEDRPERPGLRPASEANLTREEKDLLQELKARDREVRQHEQKHLAAAGTLAKGGPTFEYVIGPDGKPYATGGKVRIDTSSVPGDPEATRARADQIRRAATAPGSPSGPDMGVARDANLLQSQASREYALNAPEASDAARKAGFPYAKDNPEYRLKIWG